MMHIEKGTDTKSSGRNRKRTYMSVPAVWRGSVHEMCTNKNKVSKLDWIKDTLEKERVFGARLFSWIRNLST